MHTQVEPDIPDVEMPRMILQPIVENCYSHGLGGVSSGGEIRIAIRRRAECVEVRVCDNGAGMPPEKMEQLRALFEDDETDISGHAHIGMLNVVKRLQGFYGRRDVIEMANEGGLCVTIRLFYRREDEVHGGESPFRSDRG